LNLKGLADDYVTHGLKDGAQSCRSGAGLVPVPETEGGAVLTPSMAIIKWLDETHPDPPLSAFPRAAPANQQDAG